MQTRLRSAALLSALIAAAASVGFLLRAFHNNSMLLLALMATWVLAPFVVLAWVIQISNRWFTHKSVYILTLLITAGAGRKRFGRGTDHSALT